MKVFEGVSSQSSLPVEMAQNPYSFQADSVIAIFVIVATAKLIRALTSFVEVCKKD